MERKKAPIMTNYQKAAIAFLVIIHGVGIWGFMSEEWRPIFQQLSPFTLILSAGLLASFHTKWTKQFWLLIANVFVLSYGVEIVGVNTGLIFGTYTYGDTLGIKWLGTPPLIGLNWVVLIYVTGLIVSKLKGSVWMKITLGACLMVLLDLVMEPVAIRYDFWVWEADQIPLQNYLAWFAISWGFLFFFLRLKPFPQNKLALAFYLVQWGFFGILAVGL